MKVLYEIKEMLEDELKKICKSDSLTGSDLDEMDKMVDIIKDIETIEAMKSVEYNDAGDGYSRNHSYANANMRGYSEVWPYHMPTYARDGADMRNGEHSMARGRDATGRYTSRDSSKDEVINHLNDLMMAARSDEEREKYRRALDVLNR